MGGDILARRQHYRKAVVLFTIQSLVQIVAQIGDCDICAIPKAEIATMFHLVSCDISSNPDFLHPRRPVDGQPLILTVCLDCGTLGNMPSPCPKMLAAVFGIGSRYPCQNRCKVHKRFYPARRVKQRLDNCHQFSIAGKGVASPFKQSNIFQFGIVKFELVDSIIRGPANGGQRDRGTFFLCTPCLLVGIPPNDSDALLLDASMVDTGIQGSGPGGAKDAARPLAARSAFMARAVRKPQRPSMAPGECPSLSRPLWIRRRGSQVSVFIEWLPFARRRA